MPEFSCLGDGVSQLNAIAGSPLNIHYNPGSPQNAYLGFQTYTLSNGSIVSPAAAPADINAVWNGTTGNWSDATRWSGGVVPLNLSNAVTLYDATINGGTVTLDQTIGYIQKLNLGSGATLAGPNSVTAWDTFTWGTVGNNNPSTLSGGAVVNANGDMAIIGDSARNLDNATINNHAGYIATWAVGNSDITFANNAVFNNSGSFIVQNSRGLGHNGGTGVFNNYGTSRRTPTPARRTSAARTSCSTIPARSPCKPAHWSLTVPCRDRRPVRSRFPPPPAWFSRTASARSGEALPMPAH